MISNRIFAVTILLLTTVNLWAQYDKVYTTSGDVLIGELKSLSRGILSFDTDYADSEFQIEWDEIDGVEIDQNHLIYTADGGKYKGGLMPMPGQARLTRLTKPDGEIIMSLDDVVVIASLDQNFWERMIISIDAGLSITKANNVRQTSAKGNVSYRGDKWALAGNFSNVGTTQDDVEPIDRTEGGLAFTRDLFGNAIVLGGVEFLSNSEQMLDLRSTGKAGFGYYFIRSNTMHFMLGGGFAFSNERYGGDDPAEGNSFEGLGAAEFNIYNLGDLNFLARMMVFPSFTDPGRWRINTDIAFKYDLPLDFYVKLSYIYNFDSDPLIDVPKNDYVFQTSIGWEWD